MLDEEALESFKLLDSDEFQDAQNFFSNEEELFSMSPSPLKSSKLSRRISKRKSCFVEEIPLKEITNLNIEPPIPQLHTPNKQLRQSAPSVFSPPSALPQRYLIDTTTHNSQATPSPLPLTQLKKLTQTILSTPSKEFTYDFQLFIPSSNHNSNTVEDIPSTPMSRKIVKRDKTPSRQILLPLTPRKSSIPSTPNSQRKIIHVKRNKSTSNDFSSPFQTPNRRESNINIQQTQPQNTRRVIMPEERRFSVIQPFRNQNTASIPSSRMSFIQSNTSSKYQSIKDIPLTPLLTNRKRKLDELNSSNNIILPMDTVSTPKNLPPSYTPFKKIKKIVQHTPAKL